jgi:hypothetical protein
MMKKMKSLLTEHGQQYYQGYYLPTPGQFSSAACIPSAVKHDATSNEEDQVRPGPA